MPMWCPPTPPQQDGDVYVDQTISFLYDSGVMGESQLPPVYVKKEPKRTRLEAGLIDSRRALKIHRKDECTTYPPRSLFERPSPALVKVRRDSKMQKYRGGLIRPPMPISGTKFPVTKPTIDPPSLHEWTIHEDMALLKVIQTYQGLNLNLMISCAGHTPNWDFVADYVNTVSITYRSPKQCRHRYETVLIPREEGKPVIDTSPRKKKQKGNLYNKFSVPTKSNRPMRTSQLYQQDNNATFTQLLIQRYDALKSIAVKKAPAPKTVTNTPMLKNPKHALVLSEAGIDLDHPLLPVEVAARRAERVAREKKAMMPDQLKLQLMRAQTAQAQAQPAAAQVVAVATPQVSTVQTTTVSTVTSTIITTPSTPPNALRMQRIVASPLQNPTVVSVSGLSPAQLQAATQRLIANSTAAQAKGTVLTNATAMAGKQLSNAQLQMLRQATIKQHLRLQSGGISSQSIKTTTVTIAGQTAVQVQFTQAQPRTQYVKQGTVTVTGKQGITRTVTESEMAQLLKKQQQLQQQKAFAAAAAAAAAGGSQATTIQSMSPQVFAQAIQAGPSGAQVATLVKAVSSAGVTQTVIGAPIKTLPQGIKTATPQGMRTLQLQQQILAQKKLANQKITGIAQMTGKGGVATQLIVGSKPLSTAMTMQQFQQVIRSPLPQGPVVLAKGPPRVIPVNAAQGNKPTIQVVAATSQGITTTIRPQTSLVNALAAGMKVQGGQSPQAIFSAALQSQGVRQGSPVRIQTASGTPIVAVTVQSANPNVQPHTSDKADHVSRLIKKP